MTDPLYSSTYAPSNLILDLNFNMNLKTKHDYMYNVKYRQTDLLYVLLEPLKQI